MGLISASSRSAAKSMSSSALSALGPPTVVNNEFAAWVRHSGRVLHAQVRRNEKELSWADSASLWQSSEDYRNVTLAVLKLAPFDAFFWETPPFTGKSAHARLFEFVVVDGPHLARTRADPSDFELNVGGEIKVFPNLGNDALLVVPTQQSGVDEQAYGHLANFVRDAPLEQQHALFTTLGMTLQTEMKAGAFYGDSSPVWVNTEGSGVPWLHVRLDSRPKYYHHGAYRNDDPNNRTFSAETDGAASKST
mmetsp:Transcript_55840/g.131478  ORF Transcript_55840/g.131478 Transcript_55840/m.131478 type:complete len:250 (-) Transcript_55840:365-1114(-)